MLIKNVVAFGYTHILGKDVINGCGTIDIINTGSAYDYKDMLDDLSEKITKNLSKKHKINIDNLVFTFFSILHKEEISK